MGKSRLCGDLTQLRYHLDNLKTSEHHPTKCAYCGLPAYLKCELCGVFLHNNPARGECKGKQCFILYHDDSCFGLAKKDVVLTDTPKKEWKEATKIKMKRNKDYIDELLEDEKK